MPACLGLHSAEYVRRATSLIFVIPARFPSWFRWYRRANIGMQSDWLFVETNHRFDRIVGLLVRLQQVLHFADVLVIQFGHGRGRDAGHPAPPHRSPRAALPHEALILDEWRQSELGGMDGEHAAAESTDQPAYASAPR